jgi:BRCT domain type II-containing protein|tara:strand:+ start:567 stop:827 length:261 start_codon:yes stop_codon:yes gene_type:complete
MTKQVELKVVSSSEFAKLINETVEESKGTINHLEAVQEFLEQNEDIEPETIASLIQRNQKLKAILYQNAEGLNLVEKVDRLPVDEG